MASWKVNLWKKILSWTPHCPPILGNLNLLLVDVSFLDTSSLYINCLSLSRDSALFRDEIENYFSCSHLASRDRDYHMTILVFWDENEISYCYSHVSRQDRDFIKSFLVVEREKMKLTLVENSWDREFSLNSAVSIGQFNSDSILYAQFLYFISFPFNGISH